MNNKAEWINKAIKKTAEEKSKTLHLNGSGRGDLKLTEFPLEILELKNIEELDLSNNLIHSIPAEVYKLENIKILNLSHNRFSTFPSELLTLGKLTYLNVSNNRIKNLPDEMDKLRELNILDVSHNNISSASESIARLSNLTSLNFADNKLSELPSSYAKLRKLTSLFLDNNFFNSIPEVIYQLADLTTLTFDNVWDYRKKNSQFGNSIRNLSPKILGLKKLTRLKLLDNPIELPPPEAIGIDNGGMVNLEKLRNYFVQLERAGSDQLYEAKLLIIGEGGAGKTTLSNKIKDVNYKLRDEKTTEGIDIIRWKFVMDKDIDFHVNIWDFGGQEIYHATHQFFLTRRSLYVLVADTRKEDTDFFYWLNVVDLLSDNSPLIIVKNEKQDRHREINERSLKAQFDNLKEVSETNLATNRGLEKLISSIKHYITHLPHVGSVLPRTWVKVRETLESNLRNYISIDEYSKICQENGFKDLRDKLHLSSYLHDLGVCLHFQDDPLLSKTVILKPKWGTDAVYKVLDNPKIIRNKGKFTKKDLRDIWAAPEYMYMRDELLQLMMKFRLCYKIPKLFPDGDDYYIAPQLLGENQPEYKWDDKDNLVMRYIYEFMPKGILLQFIVAMHPYIVGRSMVWKSGVVIDVPIRKKGGTFAEITEHYGKREIRIRIRGNNKNELMGIVMHEFDKIHSSYKRLRYTKLIPCNCETCKSDEPHFYSYDELQDFIENGQIDIQCRKKPYHMVNVFGLLGEVIGASAISKMEQGPMLVSANSIENFFYGDNRMSQSKISIKDSTINGQVIMSDVIRDSFNKISSADIDEKLREKLKELAGAIDKMTNTLPRDEIDEVQDDFSRLVDETSKPSPNPKWYKVSIDGLIKAAEKIGKVGKPVIKLSSEILSLLAMSKST